MISPIAKQHPSKSRNAFWQTLGLAALLVFSNAVSAATEPTLAKVGLVRGAVTATDSTSQVRQLKRGDTVGPGDTIETDSKSVAQIVFPDRSMLYIKADSKIKLEAFQFEPTGDEKENVSVTEVLKGGMRSITGLIGQTSPENVKYRTGDTTIGIRGTAIEVNYGEGRGSLITFDYGHGFVEANQPGFCIRKALNRGDTLVLTGKDAKITNSNRSSDDATQIAERIVHAAQPAEAKSLAEQAGKDLPLEESIFTLAMLREVSQFNSSSLSAAVEGMSQTVGDNGQEPLLRNATMLYPKEAPGILEAATRGNVDIVVAVEGVMCGLQDQPSELTDRVILKAVDLGITKSQAQTVLSNLQKRGCA